MKIEEVKQAIHMVHEFCMSQKRCRECPLKWERDNCFCEDGAGETRLPENWKTDWSDE